MLAAFTQKNDATASCPCRARKQPLFILKHKLSLWLKAWLASDCQTASPCESGSYTEDTSAEEHTCNCSKTSNVDAYARLAAGFTQPCLKGYFCRPAPQNNCIGFNARFTRSCKVCQASAFNKCCFVSKSSWFRFWSLPKRFSAVDPPFKTGSI